MSKSYEERARERYTENKKRATDRAKADLAASKAKTLAKKKSAPQPDSDQPNPS